MAGLGQIRLILLEKYKKMKLGHMLEKKCREVHPPKKSMDIPSNPAPKKWLSMGVYTLMKLASVKGKWHIHPFENDYFKN